ncbi:hypothetical protein D3C76_134970 [compost metagenome]
MNYGFIYCLGNQAMPGIYKIGMTMRSPTLRALELSASTSAAQQFQVLCFAEFKEPRAVEAQLHQQFSDCRINPGREFFRVNFERIYSSLKEEGLSFCVTDAGEAEIDIALGFTSRLKAVL